MAIVTNFNELKRLRDAALVGGVGSRAWIDFAVTMCDSFQALYDTAQRMNEQFNAAEAKVPQGVLTAFERLSATGEECEFNDFTWMAFPLDEWHAFKEAVSVISGDINFAETSVKPHGCCVSRDKTSDIYADELLAALQRLLAVAITNVAPNVGTEAIISARAVIAKATGKEG